MRDRDRVLEEVADLARKVIAERLSKIQHARESASMVALNKTLARLSESPTAKTASAEQRSRTDTLLEFARARLSILAEGALSREQKIRRLDQLGARLRNVLIEDVENIVTEFLKID